MAKSTRVSEAIWIESKRYWQVKVQKDGERRAFTSSTPGRRGKHEAEGKADDWLEAGKTSMRFGKAWELFLADQKQHSGTSNYNKHEYVGRLYLEPNINNAALNRITPNMWRKCLDAANERGLSRRSIVNVKLTISAFINFARRERWDIDRLERGDLVVPKDAPPASRTILQPDALQKLFSIDHITKWGKQEKSFFIHAWRFIVLTGLRRGELCGLKNEDIEGDVVTVRRSFNAQDEETRGKNDNANRSIVLSKRAKDVLAEQRQALVRDGIISPWAFPDEAGNRLNSNHLYSMWDTYRNQHALACSLHELRHTFVSIVKEDMPEPLLKAMVGHSEEMDTTGVYGHEVTGEMKRAAKIVDIAFNRAIGPKSPKK